MKMVEMSLPLFIVILIFSTLTQSIFAVLNKSYLETNYIEDFCSAEKIQELDLSLNGTSSSLTIERKKDNVTADNFDCTVIIRSSGGVILNLYSAKGFHLEEHSDSLKILADNKNSMKLSLYESSHVFKSALKLTFSNQCCLPEDNFFITATAYRQSTGFCNNEKEFKCNTGECIWRKYQCDGRKNCPDGSDELPSKMCIHETIVSLKPVTIEWDFVFPTTKSIEEYRKTFNLTVTAAVICAFLIFLCGVLRLVCHYYCARHQTQRQPPSPPRPFATFSTFSIIRQRPDYQQDNECPPPPSYVSLISDRSNNASGNPPAYSSVVSAEENCLTEANKDDGERNGASEPPPPYEA